MATIYRAVDEHMMERPVAVKVLREVYSNDPKFVTRFQREARAASALQHPNIVQVFDYGQSGDSYYIVMEYIDGMDLRRYLKRRGVLPIERGVQIARDVSLGLGAAHKRGIVHRDVKPQNIMLNEDGLVKLTDFGIASMYKDADAERLTTTGMTLGTVQYYAPEQAQGEIVRPSADIYALGIVMYEMLTGQTPFDGDTPVAVAMKHIQEEPEPPSALNPRIPPNLERIILRCLSKSPQARFRDGEELAAALDNFLRSPSRRPGVPSGPNETIGMYGASNPNVRAGGAHGQSGPRSGGYPSAGAPTSGPRNSPRPQPQMSVNGRPGMQFGGPGGMDDARTAQDYDNAFDPRGYSVGVATPPGGPTRPWDTPDGTKPRWPGAPTEPPKRRNTALIAATVAIALVVLVAGCFLTYNIVGGLNFLGNTQPTATSVPMETVPNIVGMTCSDAEQALAKYNLKVNCTDEASKTIPVGQIISQDPTQGQKLTAGGVVQALVSTGPGTVQIPDLTNKPSADACNTLKTLGLVCAFNLQYSSNVAQGNVISTSPAKHSSVAPGSTVTLNVSNGPQPTPTSNATATPTATATSTPCPTPNGTPTC
jgi:serine/threonine-protein kinase